MYPLTSLMGSLTILAITLAGLATIVGLPSLRARCAQAALILLLLTIAIAPVIRAALAIEERFSGSWGLPPTGISHGTFVLVVLGHVVLAVVLIRRRLRGPDRARTDVQERDRVRGRERTRLPPRLPRGES